MQAQYVVTHPQALHNINNLSFFAFKRDFLSLRARLLGVSEVEMTVPVEESVGEDIAGKKLQRLF